MKEEAVRGKRRRGRSRGQSKWDQKGKKFDVPTIEENVPLTSEESPKSGEKLHRKLNFSYNMLYYSKAIIKQQIDVKFIEFEYWR